MRQGRRREFGLHEVYLPPFPLLSMNDWPLIVKMVCGCREPLLGEIT